MKVVDKKEWSTTGTCMGCTSVLIVAYGDLCLQDKVDGSRARFNCPVCRLENQMNVNPHIFARLKADQFNTDDDGKLLSLQK